MSTFAIYYKDYVSDENQIFPTMSFTMTRGNDKLCDKILNERSIEKNLPNKILITRLYELVNSPKHFPILGFVDIFKDEENNFFSRITLSDEFKEDEGVFRDLESNANEFSLKMRPKLGFCKNLNDFS